MLNGQLSILSKKIIYSANKEIKYIDMDMQTPTPNSTVSSGQSNKKTNYWFHDMTVLVNLDNMNQVLPSKEMTYPEKVNALVRLSWYIGIVAGIINTNYLYLYIPILTMIITYVLFLFRTQELADTQLKQKNEAALAKQSPELRNLNEPTTNLDTKLISKFTDYLDTHGHRTKPSDDNPFMNPLPFDNRARPPAVPLLSNPMNRADVEVRYDKGNWRDVNDVWDKNNGKRQFFTMPWTTYPNDQGGFANWLYKTPPTCKEGNGNQCVANVFDINTSNRVLGGVISGIF